MQQLQPFFLPILMLGMVGWMFYSQRKQQKSRLDSLNQIQKGDEIVTIGGLYGIVDEIDDKKVVLDIDGIYLTFDRSAIRNRVAQGAATPSQPVETVDTAVIESKDEE